MLTETENSSKSLSAEESEFFDIVGDLVEQWGFNRQTGRVWGLLYFRSQPMSPRQIQHDLGLSAGSVNSLLTELQTWGAIKRSRQAGDRNTYFEPQSSIWKSVVHVVKNREMRIVLEAKERIQKLQSGLKKKQSQKENPSEHLKNMESLYITPYRLYVLKRVACLFKISICFIVTAII